MKRSEINRYIRQAEAFFAECRFHLPPFAFWSPEEWDRRGPEIDELRVRGLGWDLTDFGRGDYARWGVLLFTLRNGDLAHLSRGRGKVYCEKILVLEPQQEVLLHYHRSKTEDLIHREGEGRLEVKLYPLGPQGEPGEGIVELGRDGERIRVAAGELLLLGPGESLTVEPGVYHSFRAVGGRVLMGEVSTVNDDRNDNFFAEPVARFPSIEEDEPPYRYLVVDTQR
jgi:D-lyxose ketol-isomerase